LDFGGLGGLTRDFAEVFAEDFVPGNGGINPTHAR